MFYVVADERDVIRLRTNYRRDAAEDVLYSMGISPMSRLAAIVMEYINRSTR